MRAVPVAVIITPAGRPGPFSADRTRDQAHANRAAQWEGIPRCPPPWQTPITWPIHHNTQDEVTTTTTRHENHEVSRVSVRR
jgi:hypothetical protein